MCSENSNETLGSALDCPSEGKAFHQIREIGKICTWGGSEMPSEAYKNAGNSEAAPKLNKRVTIRSRTGRTAHERDDKANRRRP
jgi:hypothetical protein